MHPELEYSIVEEAEGRKLILASALVEQVSAKAGQEFKTMEIHATRKQ